MPIGACVLLKLPGLERSGYKTSDIDTFRLRVAATAGHYFACAGTSDVDVKVLGLISGDSTISFILPLDWHYLCAFLIRSHIDIKELNKIHSGCSVMFTA